MRNDFRSFFLANEWVPSPPPQSHGETYPPSLYFLLTTSVILSLFSLFSIHHITYIHG